MLEENPFARNQVFPSWFTNALQRFLSVAADGFVLVQQDATHIHVFAGPDDEAAVIAIRGAWRWNEATVTRAHPGGAAGEWVIFAVAAANKIDSSPAPGTDDTNRAFDLRIVEAGHTPTIEPGVVDIYRRIGYLQWSGSAITRVVQEVPAPANHARRHAVGQIDALSPASIGALSVVKDERAHRPEPGAAGAPDIFFAEDQHVAYFNTGTAWVPLTAGEPELLAVGANIAPAVGPEPFGRVLGGGGVVGLRGVLRATGGVSGGSTIATLPSALRPSALRAVSAVLITAGGTRGMVVLELTMTGKVVFEGGALGTGDILWLDGITYPL